MITPHSSRSDTELLQIIAGALVDPATMEPIPIGGGGGGGGSTPLKYVALLTQSGTDAPVVTVLENTLGGDPVIARIAMGTYSITLAGAWVADKTAIFPGSAAAPGSNRSNIINAARSSADVITLYTRFQNGIESDGGPADGLLNASAIEIRVYP